MAGDWIKMEVATPDKPEVLAIAARMGWSDPDYAVGKLFRVWRWFDQQTKDGNAKDVTPALLDCLIGTQGFAEAMASVGWLTIRSDGIQLPGFDKHCGNTAKNRAETAKRVASHRAKKGDAAPQPVERSILPRPIRAQILKRDGHSCVYCGRAEGEYTPPEVSTAGVLHIDHVIPLSQGGSDDPQNLVTACSVCNMFKGDRTPEECGLEWPVIEGKKVGNRKSVTGALPREEKRREEGESKRASPRGERLPHVELPQDWRTFCQSERPDLDPDSVFARFADYWRAQPGAKGRKSDWSATWRNWVRDERQRPRVVASASDEPWRGAI